MLKRLVKVVASRRLVRGLLMGVGGGLLTAIGWKLGTDIYELVKRRMSEAEAPPPREAETRFEGD